MGSSAWADFIPPDDGAWADLRPGEPGYDWAYAADVAEVDPMVAPSRDDDGLPRLGITFGSASGWAPSREGGTVDLPMVAPDGEPCLVAVCGVCGSGFTRDTLPANTACGGCLRSSLDARIKSLLARPA